MEDEGSWSAFKMQLEDHYQKLSALHRELGGDYDDPSAALIQVLQAALEASLEETRLECHRVREDCESMIRDMAMMRTAMGEFAKSTGSLDDPFTSVARPQIQSPLLETQKVLRIAHEQAKKDFDLRAMKFTARYRALEEYAKLLPSRVIAIDIPHIDDEHPPEDVSLTKLGQLDTANARCAQELNRRRRQNQLICHEIIQLWAELAIETRNLDSDFDRHILLDSQKHPEVLGSMDEDIARLESKRDHFLGIKTERQQKLDGYMKTIKALYGKLRLPEHELSMFISTARGVSTTAIAICEKELARLNELKKEHIEDFVKDARVTLQELWDTLYINEDDRLKFSPAFVDIYTDASLQAHENEIARLEEHLEDVRPLLALIEKHMELDREKHDFQVQTSDPSRFAKRGYNPMAESKVRARIENTMPKVEATLVEAMNEYEDIHRIPFLVYGEPYPPKQAPKDIRVPLSDAPSRSLTQKSRPKTGDPKGRPRTPVNNTSSSSRPTTATPHRSMILNRSVSTPAATRNSKGTRNGHTPGNASMSSILAPRTDVRSASDSTTASKTSFSHIPSKVPQRLASPVHTQQRKTPTLKAKTSKVGQRQKARVITGSSTSSQVSTENWEVFHHSSEEEEEPTRPSTSKVNVILEGHLSALSVHHTALDELTKVPEEGSFVDDWDGEGF